MIPGGFRVLQSEGDVVLFAVTEGDDQVVEGHNVGLHQVGDEEAGLSLGGDDDLVPLLLQLHPLRGEAVDVEGEKYQNIGIFPHLVIFMSPR